MINRRKYFEYDNPPVCIKVFRLMDRPEDHPRRDGHLYYEHRCFRFEKIDSEMPESFKEVLKRELGLAEVTGQSVYDYMMDRYEESRRIGTFVSVHGFDVWCINGIWDSRINGTGACESALCM